MVVVAFAGGRERKADRQASEMCMNLESPRASEFYRRWAALAHSSKRAAIIGSVALFATGIWWIILIFGGWAFGYPIDTIWLLPLLGGIYFLLVLGLSMAAMAERGTPIAGEEARLHGLPDARRARRKVG